MKKALSIGGAALLLVAGAGVWIIASTPAAPTPTVGPLLANPAYVVVNTPTQVLFTVLITDPNVQATAVNLLKVDASGKTLATIGVMHDDGTNGDAVSGDRVFSYRQRVHETRVGSVYHRVSAPFKGVLQRVLSDLREQQVRLDMPRNVTASGTIGTTGGRLFDGLTEFSIPVGALSGDVRVTIATPSLEAVLGLPLDEPVTAAVSITLDSISTQDHDIYIAHITTRLVSPLAPGTVLRLLIPNDPAQNWTVSSVTAVVDESGWNASFDTTELGTLLLIRDEDIGR